VEKASVDHNNSTCLYHDESNLLLSSTSSDDVFVVTAAVPTNAAGLGVPYAVTLPAGLLRGYFDIRSDVDGSDPHHPVAKQDIWLLFEDPALRIAIYAGIEKHGLGGLAVHITHNTIDLNKVYNAFGKGDSVTNAIVIRKSPTPYACDIVPLVRFHTLTCLYKQLTLYNSQTKSASPNSASRSLRTRMGHVQRRTFLQSQSCQSSSALSSVSPTMTEAALRLRLGSSSKMKTLSMPTSRSTMLMQGEATK
jgi:hypothetical protein